MGNMNIQNLLTRVLEGDVSAADELDLMAERLQDLADKLRSGTFSQGGTTDPGGVTDRVQINVVGPDGIIKESSDTAGR